MLIEVNGHQVFAGTGGKIFDNKKPVIVYLHGSGFSHVAWAPLAGQFTQTGYSVLVLDFPGHGNSEGKVLTSIEDNALWLKDLLTVMELNTSFINWPLAGSFNSFRIQLIFSRYGI